MGYVNNTLFYTVYNKLFYTRLDKVSIKSEGRKYLLRIIIYRNNTIYTRIYSIVD